jgi:hypothetical protein
MNPPSRSKARNSGCYRYRFGLLRLILADEGDWARYQVVEYEAQWVAVPHRVGFFDTNPKEKLV